MNMVKVSKVIGAILVAGLIGIGILSTIGTGISLAETYVYNNDHPQPPTLPIDSGSKTQNTSPSSSSQEKPTPPSLPKEPKDNEEKPPSQPALPDKNHLIEDAYRELEHVVREYNATLDLIQYVKEKNVSFSTDFVNELISATRTYYNKAVEEYNNDNYIECKAYAHLALEALHGIRDVLNHRLSEAGYPPPPPPPP